MAIPRADGTIAARVKKLENELKRIKLMPSTTQTDVEPLAAVKGSVWIDSSAGNEPKVWDGASWVPVRDETIAVAQSAADTAQATVDPLVPLTDLAGQTSGTVITGATQATSDTGKRVVINDPAYPGEIVLYTDAPEEIEPARIQPVLSGGVSYLRIIGPRSDLVASPPTLDLTTNNVSDSTSIELDCDLYRLFATDTKITGFGPTGVQIGDGTDDVSFIGNVMKDADLTDASNTFLGQMLTQALSAACTSNVDVTTTEADITGATVTFSTTRANARYMCIGSFYFSALLANTGVASGKLNVDGSNVSGFANFTGTNATQDRVNSSQTWTGTLASAGSHTLKLRGVGSAAAPNPAQRINSGSTTITVMVFE